MGEPKLCQLGEGQGEAMLGFLARGFLGLAGDLGFLASGLFHCSTSEANRPSWGTRGT